MEENMGRTKFLIFIISFLCFLCGANCEASPKLWPPLEPYKTDYLQVSQLHKIFYQLGGNPEGKPVMVIHGGPGGGCSPEMFRFFNPKKFHIILHDQRGAGQSKPYAEIKENTIQNLVEDIEKLRQNLGLGKVLLFGGSWGSTLALAYAETYPQNVSGMVLRGVFTATRQKYALAWAKYEIKMAILQIPDKVVDDIFKEWNPYDFALLENFYMANNCFLKEGQLLNNADKLKDIPMTIVNGRYDVICPPITAFKLHKKLPHSKLIIVERAGHSANAEPLRTFLVNAVKAFE